MKDLYHNSRWSNNVEYREEWSERNENLLALFDSSAINPEAASFSEYGCGPNRPFHACVARTSDRKVHLFDTTPWSPEVTVVDLNSAKLPDLAQAQVAVLSGVIEYISQPDRLFEQLRRIHQYLLFSYSPIASNIEGTELLKVINKRSQNRGFRNHLTLAQLIAFMQHHGYIVKTTMWGTHVLVLLRCHE